jgi:hypothetical protein
MMALVRDVIFAVKGVHVGIYEDGCCPDVTNRLGGRKEREWRRDDFITWADSERSQGNKQGVRTAIQTNGVFNSEVGGSLLFECSDVWSHDERTTLEHTSDGGVHLILQAFVLGSQIKDRNVSGGNGHTSLRTSMSDNFS